MQRVSSDVASIARPQNEASFPLPQDRPETRQSGFETERQRRVSSATESSEVQLPAAEEKLVKRSSGSHAAAAPAKRTKRKGGAHCAK